MSEKCMPSCRLCCRHRLKLRHPFPKETLVSMRLSSYMWLFSCFCFKLNQWCSYYSYKLKCSEKSVKKEHFCWVLSHPCTRQTSFRFSDITWKIFDSPVPGFIQAKLDTVSFHLTSKSWQWKKQQIFNKKHEKRTILLGIKPSMHHVDFLESFRHTF